MREVSKAHAKEQVEAALPSYAHVPSPADLVDKVARANMRDGKQAAQQHLTQPPKREHQATALALVRALGLPNPAWTIDPRERDTADHLRPFVEDVLEAEGDAYHQALSTFLSATGSTAALERTD